ncbi:hypothetical protein Efla_001455 [Eimeria flavescens]
MAPSQKFYELLLGEDVASLLSLAGSTDASPEAKTSNSTDTPESDAANQQHDDEQPSSRMQRPAASSARQVSARVAMVNDFLRMTGDEISRQPALLHAQSEKIAAAQDELAVQNCSLFLTSSKALNSFRGSVEKLSATLAEMQQCIQPLQNGLKQFKAETNAAASREASLHILESMQSSVAELLELPSLVLNCCRGGLHNEAVDVLLFGDEVSVSLSLRGCSACTCRVQLEEARKTCKNAMLRQLGQKTQLADSIQLIGPLRRLGCSERQLSTQFLERRGVDIASQRRNAETACEPELAQSLCSAAELLRVEVLQTALHYRALFGDMDELLSAWVAEQVHWFVKLLQRRLLQGTSRGGVPSGAFDMGSIDFEAVAEYSKFASLNSEHMSPFPLGLVDLAPVFRQAYSAALALGRVQCYFFPSAAFIFERYLIAFHKHTLNKVAAAFAQSLDEYDFAPSVAYFSVLASTPWFQSCIAANPCSLFLLRHAPLANLYNSLADMVNSLQECFIASAAAGVLSVLEQFFIFCVRKLVSVKPGERREFEKEVQKIEHHLLQESEYEAATTRQAEFFVMCDVFAAVLLPTVSRHISITSSSSSSDLPQVRPAQANSEERRSREIMQHSRMH